MYPATFGAEPGMLIPEFWIAKCPICGKEFYDDTRGLVKKRVKLHARYKHGVVLEDWQIDVWKWRPKLPGDSEEELPSPIPLPEEW